jgi:hypothetical protein
MGVPLFGAVLLLLLSASGAVREAAKLPLADLQHLSVILSTL